MYMTLSFTRAPPSAFGKTNRTVCGSAISSFDPGLKFIYWPLA